jgi:hypothetical protein
MEELSRNRPRQQSSRQVPSGERLEAKVESPSPSYRTYTGAQTFNLKVPENWREFTGNDSVTFAPRGAYGDHQGQPVFTHGAIVGTINAQTRNLEEASDSYIGALIRDNRYLQPQGSYRRERIDRRPALAMTLRGQSPATGRIETVNVYTMMLNDGRMFYLINVAPEAEAGAYPQVFQSLRRSVRITG